MGVIADTRPDPSSLGSGDLLLWARRCSNGCNLELKDDTPEEVDHLARALVQMRRHKAHHHCPGRHLHAALEDACVSCCYAHAGVQSCRPEGGRSAGGRSAVAATSFKARSIKPKSTSLTALPLGAVWRRRARQRRQPPWRRGRS